MSNTGGQSSTSLGPSGVPIGRDFIECCHAYLDRLQADVHSFSVDAYTSRSAGDQKSHCLFGVTYARPDFDDADFHIRLWVQPVDGQEHEVTVTGPLLDKLRKLADLGEGASETIKINPGANEFFIKFQFRRTPKTPNTNSEYDSSSIDSA